jgi:hypothetical protein
MGLTRWLRATTTGLTSSFIQPMRLDEGRIARSTGSPARQELYSDGRPGTERARVRSEPRFGRHRGDHLTTWLPNARTADRSCHDTSMLIRSRRDLFHGNLINQKKPRNC